MVGSESLPKFQNGNQQDQPLFHVIEEGSEEHSLLVRIQSGEDGQMMNSYTNIHLTESS